MTSMPYDGRLRRAFGGHDQPAEVRVLGLGHGHRQGPLGRPRGAVEGQLAHDRVLGGQLGSGLSAADERADGHRQTQRIGIFAQAGRGAVSDRKVLSGKPRHVGVLGRKLRACARYAIWSHPTASAWSGYIIRETSHLGMPLPAAPFRAAADRWPGARSVRTRPSDAENASPLGDFHRFCSRRGNSRVPRENRARPRCGRRRFPEIREHSLHESAGSLVLLGRRFFIHICIWE